MNAVAERTDRAARWDELIATEGLVMKALANSFGSLPAERRAELVRDAEIELIDKWQAGETAWPASPAAWLVSAVDRDARDLIKSTKRRATSAAGLAGSDYETGEALDAGSEHERALAEENVQGLYALLSPTQRHIAVLRFTAELEPCEIVRQLKLSRRTVYRHLDAITNRLRAPAAELAAGDFPAAWNKLIRGHVAGTLAPHDRPKAAVLLETNTAARLLALQLRRAGDQLAALIPPVALLEPADTHGPLVRIADAASDLAAAAREAIENAAAAVKHQAVNLFGRAGETAPALASSPRPGAGAIVASCVLAAGGTVCAISGTTPKDLADIFGPTGKPRNAARKPPARKRALPIATATAQPTPRPKPKPRPRPQPKPPPATRAPAPAPAPAAPPPPAPTQSAPSPAPPGVSQDFGLQPDTPAPGPAPAPTTGPGEFGP